MKTLSSRSDGPERRKWPRVNLTLNGVVRFDPSPAPTAARVANVSARGLFLAMDTPQQKGTRLSVDLYIPDEQITLKGMVVRSIPGAGAGAGVFLTVVDERWTNFCASLSDPTLRVLDEGSSGPQREGAG